MTSSAPVLLVFLKYPAPGKVKTRLAADLGAERATGIYRFMLDLVLDDIQSVRKRMTVVAYFDGAPVEQFAEWYHLVDDWLAQPVGDLGSRLANGFAWGHERGRPVLAIGTDCPDLKTEHLDMAMNSLRSTDAVFGPTLDGGYYLVGTRRHVPGFFDGMRWSSADTLSDHRARCEHLGQSVALLPTLTDIDTATDWEAFEARDRRS